MKESLFPVLCISRDHDCNYLDIKELFPVDILNCKGIPLTDSVAALNINRTLKDTTQPTNINNELNQSIDSNPIITLNTNYPITLHINRPLTLIINRT